MGTIPNAEYHYQPGRDGTTVRHEAKNETKHSKGCQWAAQWCRRIRTLCVCARILRATCVQHTSTHGHRKHCTRSWQFQSEYHVEPTWSVGHYPDLNNYEHVSQWGQDWNIGNADASGSSDGELYGLQKGRGAKGKGESFNGICCNCVKSGHSARFCHAKGGKAKGKGQERVE